MIEQLFDLYSTVRHPRFTWRRLRGNCINCGRAGATRISNDGDVWGIYCHTCTTDITARAGSNGVVLTGEPVTW